MARCLLGCTLPLIASYFACIWLPARATIALALPPPSGPAAIGSVTLHLVDRSRWDPMAPVRVRRSLMVTVWYPALRSAAGAAAYLDVGVAHIVDSELQVANGTFEEARSHTRYEASVAAPGGRGYPVVIYSPGFGSWRNASTALVEELVSHGFVVVTIDHPYDGLAVEFPNGAIVRSKPLAAPVDVNVVTYDAWYAMVKPLLIVRIADVRFVLDELTALNAGRNPDAELRTLPSHLAGSLDLHRIGMFGHSLGGTTTALVTYEDHRIRAGLSLDGPIPAPNRAACPEQPIMLIRSADAIMARLTTPSWTSASSDLCGPRLAVTLAGSGHNDFTDLTIFARQLGLGTRQRTQWSLGSINASRAVDSERADILAFLNHWLKTDARYQRLPRAAQTSL